MLAKLSQKQYQPYKYSMFRQKQIFNYVEIYLMPVV